MRIFDLTILISALSILMSGCFSIHQGSLSSDVIESNITYRETVVGEAKSTIILGFGGPKRNALVQDAKRDMEVKRFLDPNERYVNYTIDRKDTYYFGMVSVQKLTLHADIVAINRDEDDPMSDDFRKNYFSLKPHEYVKAGVNFSFKEKENVYLADGSQAYVFNVKNPGPKVIIYKFVDGVYEKIPVTVNDVFSTSLFRYKYLQLGMVVDISDKVNEKGKMGEIVAFGIVAALVKYADDSFMVIKYQDLAR